MNIKIPIKWFPAGLLGVGGCAWFGGWTWFTRDEAMLGECSKWAVYYMILTHTTKDILVVYIHTTNIYIYKENIL